MSTILCDGTDTDEIINEFGTEITIISVTTTYSNDEYHEPIEAETEVTTTGVVETVSSEEDRVKEGLFQTGDIYVHLKMGDQQYASIGNYIIYSNDKYKIKIVNKEQRGDVVYVTGVGASIYERNAS